MKKNEEEFEDEKGEDVEFEASEYAEEENGDFGVRSSRLEDKLAALKKKLKASEEEKREYLEGLQRSKADFVNYKNRTEEAVLRREEQAKINTIAELFPVLDSLDAAIASDWFKSADESLQTGIMSVYKQTKNTFEKFGIVEAGRVGELFNPEIHTSVSVEPTGDERKVDTVAEVLQKGYITKDGLVIRSPKVVVFSKEE